MFYDSDDNASEYYDHYDYDGNDYCYYDSDEDSDDDEFDDDDDVDHCTDKTDKKGILRKPSYWEREESKALSQFYIEAEKRTAFSDITVKVQTQVFHLNRIILALKSAYFETLFTGDFEDRKNDEIEIHTIDEDTFSSIVDYIYGADLKNEVVDERNFATIFMAMDYLLMEINVKFFRNFIIANNDQLDDGALLQLGNYVSLLPEFQSITTEIIRILAINLKRVSTSAEFLSLAPPVLTAVLSVQTYEDADKSQENHYIVEICAEWICHDFQERLPHIVDLVNAAKRRFGISFAISSANYRPFVELDERRRKERVQKYFNRLLNHTAEIRPEPPETGIGGKSKQNTSRTKEVKSQKYDSVHKIDYAAKWKMNIEQKNFCDVSIRAGDEVFRLHRIQLSLDIPYFCDLFSQSPHQDEYVLEAAIDAATFTKILNYVYYEKIDLTNNSQDVIRLLRCCLILQMYLKNEIYRYVINNLNLMKGIAFELLYFTMQNEEFHHHNDRLETFIGVTWEEICKETGFHETPIDALEYAINLPNLLLNDENGLLNICTDWIHYDVKNRYQFIPKLALAINGCPEIAFEKYNSAQQENFCLAQQIEHQLKTILWSTQLVSTRTILVGDLAEELVPHFVIMRDEEICIVNADFDQITSLLSLSPIMQGARQRELSAVIINDDLFMLFVKDRKFSFQVYNFRSKKFKSLSCNFKTNSFNFHLINRNNELYFCSACEEHVWKYSPLLNRWIRLFQNKVNANDGHFITSNGNICYEILVKCYPRREIHVSDFKKQSWVVLEHPASETKTILDVSIVDGNLAILFHDCTAIYRQEIQTWKLINHRGRIFSTFKQFGDSILYVRDPLENHEKGTCIELHSFSIIHEQWQLKKKLQIEFKEITPILSV